MKADTLLFMLGTLVHSFVTRSLHGRISFLSFDKCSRNSYLDVSEHTTGSRGRRLSRTSSTPIRPVSVFLCPRTDYDKSFFFRFFFASPMLSSTRERSKLNLFFVLRYRPISLETKPNLI